MGPYRKLIEAEGAKYAELEIRKLRIGGIVSQASLEELNDANHEFDPFKADFIDRTITELAGSNDMKSAKQAAHIGRIVAAATEAYNANPLQPYLRFAEKESLRRRGKSWVHWAIGTLIDRI